MAPHNHRASVFSTALDVGLVVPVWSIVFRPGWVVVPRFRLRPRDDVGKVGIDAILVTWRSCAFLNAALLALLDLILSFSLTFLFSLAFRKG